jgi:KipI family sensor histidine kinase inhibitor
MTGGLNFRSLADSGLTVEFDDQPDRVANARVMALHRRLSRAREAGQAPGLVETVPTIRSLTLHYDPLLTSRRELEALVADHLGDEAAAPAATRWRLPCLYGGAAGPDLDAVAAARGLSPAQVVALHAATEVSVYMLGFMPGFAYMGDLPPELESPRRAEPRLAVPAGSVAIAGRLTGVYPWESPGGWHLLGNCPIPMFDPGRSRPVLLAAGDRVGFEPIDEARYAALKAEVENGTFDIAALEVMA